MSPALLGAEVTVTPGARVRTFGGWYRHDVVAVNGVVVGRIQTRRRNGRLSIITGHDASNTCVLGRDLAWLVGRALEVR